jgi:formylglycine-generating enzyme required for sulfatase activity
MASGPLGPFILRSGTDGSYTYSAVSGTENQPVRNVSFYDGIRLANWLANGQGNGDTETGSYTLANGIGLTRNANATWVVPSEDEWYKAAYYDAHNVLYHTYPNGSDAVPAEPTDETTPREMNFGGPPFWQGTQYYTSVGQTTGHSPYGVYDMGGNVQEWTDTFKSPSYYITRGGELMDGAAAMSTTGSQPYDPTTDGDLQGLRLADIIPEPTTMALFLVGFLGIAVGWVRRKRR